MTIIYLERLRVFAQKHANARKSYYRVENGFRNNRLGIGERYT